MTLRQIRARLETLWREYLHAPEAEVGPAYDRYYRCLKEHEAALWDDMNPIAASVGVPVEADKCES